MATDPNREQAPGRYGVRGFVIFLVIMWLLTSLPVWTLFANRPVMWGPLPMVVTWSYGGFLVIMLAVIWAYYAQFRPWSSDFEANMTEHDR